MQTPNISIRKHFRLPPSKPIEPTSTLVLTSHKSYYIDVRLYNHPPPDTPPSSLSRLEWAFAGISHSTPSTEPNGPSTSVWNHWIDSKSLTPGADEGLMYDVGSGETLEKGTMKHPETGKECDYEELWGDVQVERVEEGKENVCVVLRLENEEKGLKGLVVRVGGWCQGMLRGREEVAVERWRCKDSRTMDGWSDGGVPEERVEEEGWQRITRLGDGEMPCNAAFNVQGLREGAKVKARDVEWEVLEVLTW